MAVPLTLRQRAEFRIARALSALPPRVQVALSGGAPVRRDGLELAPDLQLALAVMERQGNPATETLTPVQAREERRRQAGSALGPPLRVGEVAERTVPGPAGPLAARHYAPAEAGPRPLLLFLHGGGFVLGDRDTHDGACRLICRHAGVHVLSVEYRLAPEEPFPAALEDARAVLDWGLAHAGELGADPARVALGGDSAGGNLAAVATLLAAREGRPLPHLQLLIYPTTDMSQAHRSEELFAEGFYLTRSEMTWFEDHYRSGADASDPRLSPLLADDLSGLPPALVLTAGFDPLRDEGEAYAERLREAGNVVVLRRFPGLVHGFVNFGGITRSARDAVVELSGALRALLEAGGAQSSAMPGATPTSTSAGARAASA